MNQNEMVSIVIPSYNRALVISNAINSILNQSYQNFEIFVIDDGSTDNTEELVCKICDPRIVYVKQENGGGGKARNTGIDLARGNYIAFLDSDDLFCEFHIEQAIALVCESSCVFSQIMVKREDNSIFLKPPRSPLPEEDISEYLLNGRGFIQTSTIVLPTKIAREVRFDESLRYGQDTDFVIRLSHSGISFVMAERPSVIWDDIWNEKRTSSSIDPNNRIDWLKKNRKLISIKAYKADMGWNVAKGLSSSGHKFEALYYYFIAIINGCYGAKLAITVFLQVFLSPANYRKISNVTLKFGLRP
jgi:glycosyltransferase involved in cell wall biosynthesis